MNPLFFRCALNRKIYDDVKLYTMVLFRRCGAPGITSPNDL